MKDTSNRIEDLCYLVGFKDGITLLQKELQATKELDTVDKQRLDCKINMEMEKVNGRLRGWLGYNTNGFYGTLEKEK